MKDYSTMNGFEQRISTAEVYRTALRALGDFDIADLTMSLNDRNQALQDSVDLKFSEEIDDLEERNAKDRKDWTIQEITKVLAMMIEECVRRWQVGGFENAEVYVAGILVQFHEDGVSIQYRPIDAYTPYEHDFVKEEG